MNKILCPIDFSATSLNAIEFAVEIGKKFHSRLTLFHVFTERDFNKAMGKVAAGKSFKELLAMASNKMKVLAEEINDQSHEEGLEACDFIIDLGELVDKINITVTDENYDLVVMGTTGVSRTNGVFFGSNTEDVIEDIKQPVLCIPSDFNYQEFKKIVYGSDYLEEDRLAIQEVISFATMFDARVNVLHVNIGNEDEEYDEFTQELKSFITYDKISFLNRKYDHIGEGLNSFMQQEGGDLLVVYKRQRGIVGSIFSKSLTKLLAFSTDKPLLVLKLK